MFKLLGLEWNAFTALLYDFFPIEFLLNSAVVARYKIQETCDTFVTKGAAESSFCIYLFGIDSHIYN